MNSSTQPPATPQSPVNPIQQTSAVPSVPVSSQSLTMDPNMMTIPSAPEPQNIQAQASVLPKAQPPIAQPQSPIGGPKEAAPLMQAPVAEYIHQTVEAAPELPQEVAETGVEVVANTEQPQLTPEHQAVGIQHSPASAPFTHPAQTGATVQVPYSAQEAKQIEKQTSLVESRHWLAILTEYLLKKIQAISA